MALFIGFTGMLSLNAVDVNWLSAADGDWTESTNWSSDPSLPGASDVAIIGVTTGSAYTVTYGTGTASDSTLSETVNRILLGTSTSGAPAATLHLKGGVLTADIGDVSSTAPFDMTNANLLIDSGAELVLKSGPSGGNNGYRGLNLSGNATATINGTVTSLPSVSGTIPGGGLRLSGSSGQVNTFTVNAGANASFGYSFIGASGSASTNNVYVDGGTMSMRALELGRSGTSTLYVENGGTLANGGSGGSIGGGTGGGGTGELIIGESGGVSSGTVTSVSSLSIGTGNQSATGTMTLYSGSFSFSTTSTRSMSLSTGANASGYLNIYGGEVNITNPSGADSLILAPAYVDAATGVGVVNLDGGTLNVDKLVSQTVAGSFNFDSGTFTVKQATVDNGKAFVVGNGTDTATITFLDGAGSGDHTFTDGLTISDNAKLTGIGRIGTGVATIEGTVAATGQIEFADGITFVDGSVIDLNDAAGSIYISGGNLTIADAANVNILYDSYVSGESLTVFTATGGIVGTDLSGVNFTVNGFSASGGWSGNDFLVAVPEPSTVGFGVIGALIGLLHLYRRKTGCV